MDACHRHIERDAKACKHICQQPLGEKISCELFSVVRTRRGIAHLEKLGFKGCLEVFGCLPACPLSRAVSFFEPCLALIPQQARRSHRACITSQMNIAAITEERTRKSE